MPTSGSKVSPFRTLESAVLFLNLAALAVFAAMRWGFRHPAEVLPLQISVLAGMPVLLGGIVRKAVVGDLGADLLAGIALVTAALLGEWPAGALVAVMLGGGAALERIALVRAGSALGALARRAPSLARLLRDGREEGVPLERIVPGDLLVVPPHEACPVDGVVVEGRSVMDESYLTGEPFMMPKAPGSEVLSGAVNGDGLLRIRAVRAARDSRFEQILGVMKESEQRRPRLRRLGDRLGAVYVPVSLALAVGAWAASGEPVRFLAVLAVATPCPLIIGIPVAILGAISLAARRGIVIRDPAVLERLDGVRTILFDKTGTLTAGEPRLTHQDLAPGMDGPTLLAEAASLERYSRHPLAGAIVKAAQEAGLPGLEVEDLKEAPGRGLEGRVGGRSIRITGRREVAEELPPLESGLECVLFRDGRYAGRYRFHDVPRDECAPFVGHLPHRHRFNRFLIVSGDRLSEVAYLAKQVGIGEIHAGKSPEEKVAIVREETRRAPTLFLGDGINDAAALLEATVGVAFGRRSDVTASAAGAVILEDSLQRVDELFHIASRLRTIALQSALGGMLLSAAGMALAAVGALGPAAGALAQEFIDLLAILNALRMAAPMGRLHDY
jgi:heavy metal translocating P-type ATPase